MRRWIAGAAGALVAAGASVAVAQDAYPTRPVRIIVPFSAGGGRRAAAHRRREARSGNGDSRWSSRTRSARRAISAWPKALAPRPTATRWCWPRPENLTVNPTLFPKLAFDTHKDLIPVTLLAQSPNVLVVHPSVPAKNLRELIAYAKANPDKLNFARPATGAARTWPASGSRSTPASGRRTFRTRRLLPR